jgi:hypothetical protein
MIADRIIAWALAFALTIAPALADGVSIPGLMSIGGKTSVQFPSTASAPSPASFTPGPASPPTTNGIDLAFANTTKTFSGINGSVNFPSGSMVLVGFFDDLGSTTPGTPLIGGQAATQIAADSTNKCRLFQATMPASEPDTFSFATAGGFRDVGVIVLGSFQNLQSNTASATGAETFGGQAGPQFFGAAITVPSAPAWGLAYVAALTAPTALTWTGTTSTSGDGYFTVPLASNNVSMGTAHTTTVGSFQPHASGVTNNMSFDACMAGGTWH